MSDGFASKPVEPGQQAPAVDGGPIGGGDIPSHQTEASGTERSGTQDPLRGQGNSATTTFSREDYAPVSRSQRKDDVESQKAEEEKRMANAGGQDDFRQSTTRDSDEPAPGRVDPNLNSYKNLVEAGTNMAGSGGASSGSELPQPPPIRPVNQGKAKL